MKKIFGILILMCIFACSSSSDVETEQINVPEFFIGMWHNEDGVTLKVEAHKVIILGRTFSSGEEVYTADNAYRVFKGDDELLFLQSSEDTFFRLKEGGVTIIADYFVKD